MSKKYFLAIFTLIGAITGAGVFAMPYVLNKAGLIPFLILFPFLVAAQCLIHLLFAKIILSTKEQHRVPGYVGFYAGRKWGRIVSIFCIAAGYGSLLAYIILGGSFLQNLLSPFFGGDLVIYSTILFAFEAFVILAGIRLMLGVETFLTVVLIFLFVFLTVKCFGIARIENYNLVSWKDFLLPYGAIFFAISGDTAIPEVCRILKDEKRKIKSAIIWGTVIPAFLMLAFVLAVAGVTGVGTSPEALNGLEKYFNSGVITAASIFGLLCITTSCLVYFQAIREIFWWDFKLDKKLSWALAGVVPYVIFILGLRNITTVVSLNGLITGSILGIVMVLLALKVDKKPQKNTSVIIRIFKPVAIILCALFVIGLLSELIVIIF